MALVGKRDGRNFGYGRQLSYAGPQALRDLFGGGHYGTVKAHSDRWLAFVGAGLRMGRGLMMRGRLIGRPCWTMPNICGSKLNMVSLPSRPHKIGYPV